MQSAEDFMKRFLSDQAELHRSWLAHWTPFLETYYIEDCRDRRDRAYMLNNQETLQSVTTAEDSAQAVTTGVRYGNQQWRSRYQLRPTGDSWRIHSKEMECGICNGTGKWGSGACSLCKGKGWISAEEAV